MRVISADSHVVEPADLWTERMRGGPYEDRAPHIVDHERKGHLFVVDGVAPAPVGLFGAAGKPSSELRYTGDRVEDLRRGGWETAPRLEDMDEDGVDAEVLYPSIGMYVAGCPDEGYQLACMRAYNDWLREFCAAAPGRLAGLAMIPTFDVEAAIEEIDRTVGDELRGILIPGRPTTGHYAEARFDPLWARCADAGIPVSFHILTGGDDGDPSLGSGLRMMWFMSVIHAMQQTTSLFIFGGVFDRHPELALVSAEHDAGWAAHFAYRLDQKSERFGGTRGESGPARLPSEYLRHNVSYTFQDDPWAVVTREGVGVSQLMWASDYPHSDSTWPHSAKVIARDFATVPAAELEAICGGNAARIYRL